VSESTDPTGGSDTPASTPPPTPDGAAVIGDVFGAGFGESLALLDGTALVGDAGGGVVAVFERVEEFWSDRDALTPPDEESGSFGEAVVLTAGGALVGDPNGPGQSAYRSTRADGSWSDPVRINDQFGIAGAIDPDGFGAAIAVREDIAVIGSPRGEGFPSGRYAASAYVYERASSEAWLPEAKFVSARSPSRRFGEAVAMAGTTALVADPRVGNSEIDLDGAVYAFEGAGYENWRRNQSLSSPAKPGAELLPRGASLGDDFGWSIAADGVLLVGAPGLRSPPGEEVNGAAYVFERSDGAWRQEGILLGEHGLPAADVQGTGDGFGFSVALDGDRALVSAPGDPAIGADHRGAAYLFEREGGAWVAAGRLLTDAGEQVARFVRGGESDAPQVRQPATARARFGGSVALSGGTALVQTALPGPDGTLRPAVEVFDV